MICKTIQAFQEQVLTQMTFKPYPTSHYTLYQNVDRPELGYFIKYSREGFYDLGIGDYTIPSNFSLSFDHQEEFMRFGTVYTGETSFKIENSPISSFSPSSFFVVQDDLKGEQLWTKGQHFHGTEITIYKKYFDEVIQPNFPDSIDLNDFLRNYTYRYLPLEVTSIIQNLKNMAESKLLTPLYLESKILESIALLTREIHSSSGNAFTNQIDYGKVQIGTNRWITLTATDIHGIQEAYRILTDSPCNPPTIKSLSKMVFLNEQKLKAGFLAKYHMSIGEYTTSLKMAMAENLLSTTELSIEEISKKLGYHYSGNFIKMFKKVHGKTPLAFRKVKS